MGKAASNVINGIKDTSNFVDNNTDAFDLNFNFVTSNCFDDWWPICSSATRTHYKAYGRKANG